MKEGLIVLLIIGFISGCGSASSGASATSSGAVMNASNLSGSYNGSEAGTQNSVEFSQNVSLILTQNEQSVSGTFDASSGSTGTVSGTNTGSGTIYFQISASAPCEGDLTGSVSITENGLEGSVVGSTSCGAVVANINLTLQ